MFNSTIGSSRDVAPMAREYLAPITIDGLNLDAAISLRTEGDTNSSWTRRRSPPYRPLANVRAMVAERLRMWFVLESKDIARFAMRAELPEISGEVRKNAHAAEGCVWFARNWLLATLMVFTASLWNCGNARASVVHGAVPQASHTSPNISVHQLPTRLLYEGRTYEITYITQRRQIVLKVNGRPTVLHQIPKEYDPSIVGSEAVIGFLPDRLQPYKKSKILLYLSSIRTSGGAGGGQCGSGSEIHVNFLDVRTPRATVQSRILIGSCQASIELADQDLPIGQFGSASVVGSKLAFHFMNYGGMEGSPTATVSSDFRRLDFK